MSPKPKIPVEDIVNTPPENMIMTPLLTAFAQARMKGAPLIMIETPDAGATQDSLLKLMNGKNPTYTWDAVRGLRGIGEQAEGWLKVHLPETSMQRLATGVSAQPTTACANALVACERMDPRSVIFCYNLHLYVKDTKVLQALWNLRDPFKGSRRTIVGFGVSFQLPTEISGDVIVLDEPLPKREELGILLDHLYNKARNTKDTNLPALTDAVRTEALDALVGLPHFTAEQCTSLSIEKDKLNIPTLWTRKIKAIENQDGMRVWKAQPEDSLDNLRGIDNVVQFVRDLWQADAFGAIAFIDEGDKALAGGMSDYSGDSGVAKDQVGTVLSYIEDTKSIGIMLAGLAGCGKTQLVKALGATSRKPVIVFDLGGMKGGTVGQSERTIRNNLKVLSATAQGRILFMMTANQTVQFTPEVNRRFPWQFFFDIPTDTSDIWDIYVPMFGLTPEQALRPAGFANGWTGAEVRRACENAKLLKKSVVDVARYIIPMSVSKKPLLDEMRRHADGNFLSAAPSRDGWYHQPTEQSAARPERVFASALDDDI